MAPGKGGAAVAVTRAQVIAYRVASQGLHRTASSVDSLAVLGLGVQEAMGHPAALAFAARLPGSVDLGPESAGAGPDGALALAWTFRGAPHVHRRGDLDDVAGALRPLSEADAAGRLNETGPSVRRSGIPALVQFDLVVAAMTDVVTAPTAKGVASAAVTRRLPAVLRRTCRPCGTEHVSDSAMRAAAPVAGLELDPSTSPPVLLPRPGATRPRGPDPAALTALARAYAALLGPAGPGEFAGQLGARRADVARYWPDDLVAVDVDGRRAWLPEPCLVALQQAPAPELVRLLGPFDPYLQARDRDLIVPDPAVQKALWPVLGRPGALLVDGEIAGTWRTKASAGRLTITVDTFRPLPASVGSAIEVEAGRVAGVRGCGDVRTVVRAGAGA